MTARLRLMTLLPMAVTSSNIAFVTRLHFLCADLRAFAHSGVHTCCKSLKASRMATPPAVKNIRSNPKKRCAWLCSTRCFASINVVHRSRVELGKPRGSRWQSGVLQRFLTLTAVVVGAVLVCHASTKTLGTLLKLVVDVISPEQPACQREIDQLVRGLRCTTLHVVCKRRHTLSVPFTKITSGEIVVVEMGDPFIPTILVNQLVHASLQEVCLGLGSWWRWHFVSFAGWLSVALLR